MGIAATIWPGWTPAAPAPSRSTTPTRSHPGVKGTGCEQGERWTLPLPVTPRAASAVHALLRLAVPCARRVGVARGPVEVRRAGGRRRGRDALVQLAEAGIRERRGSQSALDVGPAHGALVLVVQDVAVHHRRSVVDARGGGVQVESHGARAATERVVVLAI